MEFKVSEFGYALIIFSPILLVFAFIWHYWFHIKNATKIEFEKYESIVPKFKLLVYKNYAKKRPDNLSAQKFIKEFENEFQKLWKGYDARSVISDLNVYQKADESGVYEYKEFRSLHGKYGASPSSSREIKSNVGFAEIDLNLGRGGGNIKQILYAFSANGFKIKKESRPVVLPAYFIPVSVNPVYKGDDNRKNCVENRLLNYLQQKYHKNITGSIEIYTERIPCESCMQVIEKFRADNRNLKISIAFMVIDNAKNPKHTIDKLINLKINPLKISSLSTKNTQIE